MVAARIANMSEGRPKKTTEFSAVSHSQAAKILNLSPDSVQSAKKVIQQVTLQHTNQTIMGIYLACYSQEGIAAAVNIPRKTVADKIDTFGDLDNLEKSAQTLANHKF